jgi:DNA invertase Pin-like site-specific DNA recombinase
MGPQDSWTGPEAFAAERGLKIAAWYTENESGTRLDRPEPFRLLADAQPGDILLVEQVDRLSRLIAEDWERLKTELTARRVRVVALDLPTSWMMATNAADEFTGRMFEAINGMLLDMLAAVARKDYDDRRRRQAQGQAKAKARYKGRPEDAERNEGIGRMIVAGQSWSTIQAATGCSRATIAKIAKRIKQAAWSQITLTKVKPRSGGAFRLDVPITDFQVFGTHRDWYATPRFVDCKIASRRWASKAPTRVGSWSGTWSTIADRRMPGAR